MERLIVRKYPVDPAVVEKALRILKEYQILIGSFDYSQEKTYDGNTYILQSTLYETELSILVDRNLFSFMKSFALGIILSERKRILLGALMVVAITYEMTFEPSVAIYEYAEKNGNTAAYQDIQIFYHADNLPLEVYVDLFLGKLDRIPDSQCFKQHLSFSIENDFTIPLKNWSFNYPLVLKIAQLERSALKPNQRMDAYLEWMWSDYLFSAVSTLFGVIYLSPGKCGHKGLIKDLFSSDQEKRLAGLHNACWDLCLIQEWMKLLYEQKDQNKLWLLASADKALSYAARRIATSQFFDQKQLDDMKSQIFTDAWGLDKGMVLFRQYQYLWGIIKSPERKANTSCFSRDYCEKLTMQLESEVLS
jgi:hypothetical protein